MCASCCSTTLKTAQCIWMGLTKLSQHSDIHKKSILMWSGKKKQNKEKKQQQEQEKICVTCVHTIDDCVEQSPNDIQFDRYEKMRISTFEMAQQKCLQQSCSRYMEGTEEPCGPPQGWP